MKYEVVLTESANRQLDEACTWYIENAPQIADDWYNGFVDALAGLEVNPDRFGLARENQAFPIEIRQLLYGSGRRKTHRAIFSIHSDRVVVRTNRHLSRQDLGDNDL